MTMLGLINMLIRSNYISNYMLKIHKYIVWSPSAKTLVLKLK